VTQRTVVHSERHVERLARAGEMAETRVSLAARLLDALAPSVRVATPETTRLALEIALARVAAKDSLLAGVAGAGGRAWLWTIDAVDEAISAIRAANVPERALAEAARLSGSAGARATTLRRAIRALDAELERIGLVDARAVSSVLTRVLDQATPDQVVAAVGANTLVARGIVAVPQGAGTVVGAKYPVS